MCGAKIRFFLDSASFFSLTTVTFVNSITDFVNFETPPDEKCRFSMREVPFLFARSAVSLREKCNFSKKDFKFYIFTKTLKTPRVQSAAYGLHCCLARLCLRARSRTTIEPSHPRKKHKKHYPIAVLISKVSPSTSF